MTLITALFLLLCIVVGYGITGFVSLELRLEERLPIAVVVGSMVVTLTSLATIALVGFSGAAVVIGLLLALAVSVFGWRRLPNTPRVDGTDFVRRLRQSGSARDNPWPLLVLVSLCWPLTIRIMSLAYQTGPNGAVQAGHLSVFGDWQAHLAYGSAFAQRDGLDLTTPLASGEDFAYHFGVDLFAALTVPTGIDMPAGLTVTTGFLALAIPPILYMFGARLFERRSIAALGPLIFLGAGGLGFFRFFDDVRAGGWGVLWRQSQDYTRDFDTLWMDNPVLGHLYAQRPTMIGFPALLVVLTLVWRAVDRRTILAAGVLTGLLPIFHTFSWGTALLLGSFWVVLRRRQDALWFVVPAVALAAPVVAWLVPPSPSGTFRWHWAWVSDGAPWDIAWFWAWNTGLFPVLFVMGLTWRAAVRRELAIAIAPIWLWWVGVHLALPHPWPGNNAKYAIFWWMLGAFVVAAVLVELVREATQKKSATSSITLGFVVIIFVSLIASGSLDILAAVDGSGGAYPATTMSGGEVLVGEWAQSTADDAVFVSTPDSTSQPVSALGGRQVVSASSGWVYDLGLNWLERAEDSKAMLRGDAGTEELVAKYGVDFVVVGPGELRAGANVSYWDTAATLVYDLSGVRVYEVDQERS